jgi:lipopolysaccharide/colanic/teichoic acid biosynthesis glycosyltransferase
MLDVAVAGALLVFAAPIVLLVALAIVLESPGPVLYRGRRVGANGVEFDMLKFRKMRHGAVGPRLTADGDERLTRVGAILARTKLDELPQLHNVLRGQMSVVGPRPEDPMFVGAYPTEFRHVLSVRPGVTGLSQLAFAKEALILARPELSGRYVDRLLPTKLAIDLLYVRKRSLRLDLAILGWTAAAVLLRKDVAVDRRTARLSVRHPEAGNETHPVRRAA